MYELRASYVRAVIKVKQTETPIKINSIENNLIQLQTAKEN